MDPPNLEEFNRQILKLLIGPALKIADKIAEEIFANHSFKGILEKLEVLKELLDENPKSSMMIKVTEGFPEWTASSKISYLYLELAHNDGRYLTPGMGVPHTSFSKSLILEEYLDGTIKDANILVEKLCGHKNKLFAFIIQHAVFYVKNVRGGL